MASAPGPRNCNTRVSVRHDRTPDSVPVAASKPSAQTEAQLRHLLNQERGLVRILWMNTDGRLVGTMPPPGDGPVMVFVLVTSVTGSFQIFDTVAVATNGGPLDSTRVIVHYIVQNAFGFFRMGYASAMSVVLGLVMVAYTILQMQIMRANENDLA